MEQIHSFVFDIEYEMFVFFSVSHTKLICWILFKIKMDWVQRVCHQFEIHINAQQLWDCVQLKSIDLKTSKRSRRFRKIENSLKFYLISLLHGQAHVAKWRKKWNAENDSRGSKVQFSAHIFQFGGRCAVK